MNSSDPATLLTLLIVSLAALAVWILYLLTVKGVLQEVNPEHRAVRVEQIWLLLIPGFNFFWYPIFIHRTSKSIRREYADRGIRPLRKVPGEMAGYLAGLSLLLSALEWKVFLPVVIVAGMVHWIQWYQIKQRLEGFSNIL
jgi:hypothetical protein